MRISKIKIDSVLGIEHLEIEPGSVTELRGANGVGKTSVLDSLRAVLGGGQDATLLKQGAEKGEIVLLLDDGTEVRKRITADKSDTTVTHPTYGKISKPAAYLKKLYDALSLNPIAFLTAAPKDRVEILLEALPMKVDASQLGFVPVPALEGVNCDDHALTVLGKIGRNIYDFRTGVDRAKKEKRATAKQMSETLPADAPEGNWGDVLETTTAEYKALQRDTQRKVADIKNLCTLTVNDCRTGYGQQAQAVRHELEKAIERLKADSEIAINRICEARDRDIEAAQKRRDEELQAAEAEYRPINAALSEKLGQAKAMVEQHTKAESTRSFIAQLTQEADKLDAESSKLTHAMGRLEVLKASLLERLPIEGLEIREGELFLGGLPFDRCNTAKKVDLAIEVAKLRSGASGLVACDGLECLDAKTFEVFKRKAAKSGLQFVVAKVTNETALTIATDEEAQSA